MSLSEEQIQTLHGVISQFRELQDTLPTQFQGIREQLAIQQQQIHTLVNNNHVQPTQVATNIKVRSPTTFDGKSGQCGTFFSQLAVYFAANSDYNTDEKKIMFAISCVSGPVFAFLEPFVSQLGQPDKPDILINYEVFKSNLINAFGDSDPIITAENQLRHLRQDNLPVSIYATRFRMYAQIVEWNDAALMSQFKVNLSTAVQNELARRPIPTSLESLISETIDIDNKLIKGPRERRNINNNSTRPQPSAMDVDPKPQQGRLTREERDRRNQTNSCFYCGSPDHFKRDCPKFKSGAHHLNTFVLNSLITTEQQCFAPKFCDLPAARLVSETTKNTHVQVPHAQDGLLYVPLVFGTTKPGQFKRVQALLDTGASMSIVRQDLVDSLALQDDTVPTSASFIVGNGQATVSSAKLSTKIRISNSIFHSEMHKFYVVKDCNFQVILGLDWIRKHGVSIDFDNKITDIKCRNTLACCPIKSAPQDWLLAVVPVTPLTDCASPTPSFHSCDTSFSAEFSSVHSPFVPPLDHTLYDTRMGSLTFGLNKDLTFSAYSSGLSELSNDSTSLFPSSETITYDYETNFAKVFSKIEADKLPPHRSYDHKIPQVPDAVVPYGPMYSMSQLELKTLYDYIQENLAKGFIRRSESPAGAPVLFVKKKDGSLRMVVDYRGLNKVTIATPAVLPLISETLDRLNQAKYFSKLDMVGAYNLIRIKPGDEWKTAWICRYGHFEYSVMSFGLCSAPTTFQAYVNDVLRDYLDQFLVVYLDDVLIFSQSQSQQEEHVRLVLQKLQDA